MDDMNSARTATFLTSEGLRRSSSPAPDRPRENPALTSQAQAATLPSPAQSAPAAAVPPENPCRVLVVDDNVDAALSLAMLLDLVGHPTRTVCDGPEVLGAAIEFRPHVVLLDIGLPVLNGYAVARQLRRQPGLEDVVLVAMTGFGRDSDRQHAHAAGFDHHLVKPADFSSVQAILAAAPTTP